MTRAKKPEQKKQAGRKSLFSKRKGDLLVKFNTSFLEQKSRKQRSAFYNKLANWCIARWGYRADLSIDEDDEDNDPDEEVSIEDSAVMDDDDLSEDDAKVRVDYYDTIRTVCYPWHTSGCSD